MAKVDYVKINNTINYIQNVAYLSELPVANENSADFVSVNNELYVKQVNGTTYTYAKVGGSGGSAEPIIKTMTETETGVVLVFTEEELTQIQNNLGTVVKVDMGEGEYLPLSPAYLKLSINSMQPQLILCCEIVEYNAWYKFKPTEDPLVYVIDQDMSSPFGDGNDIEQEYQFIEFPLNEMRDSEIASAAATANYYVGLLDNQNNFASSKPLVLIEGDIARAKTIMQQLAMTKVPLEDDVNVCIANCNGTVIRYVENQNPICLPIVEVSSFIEDDNELADGIKNGTYSVKTNVYSVKGTTVPIISYTGFYNGTQITFEARPLYQKLLSSDSYSETDLYAIVFADVSAGTTYIQQRSLSSSADCKAIIDGNYTSVRYMQNNEVFGNIIYKTSDTYICEIFGDFTNANMYNYVGVVKTYLRCKYYKGGDAEYGYFQNVSSSVIANPKSGELNNATSGGTLTQLLVNDKVYDIPSGGGGSGSNIQVVEVDSDTIDLIIG